VRAGRNQHRSGRPCDEQRFGVSASTPSAGPMLFVGFDQVIDPGTISILWEVAQEEDFSALLPLGVTGVGPAAEKIALNSGDHTALWARRRCSR